jgi:hypothetical protein
MSMDFIFWAILLYLAFNGFLQMFFVWWVLDRNKKLTLLLAEYYRNIDKGEG